MIYKMRYIAILIVLGALLFPQRVLAHEFATSGTTGVVLHIEPGDAPKANQSSLLQIDIADAANKFGIDDCECSVNIISGNKSLFTYNITKSSYNSSLITSSFDYTFPKSGNYEIVVTGRSKTNSFLPFSIPFRTKVSSGVSLFQITLMFTVLAVFFGIIFIILHFLTPKKHKINVES